MEYKTTFNFLYFYDKFNTIYPNLIKPSESFLQWLIGFVEGDGSFIVNSRGDLAFVISQSTIDIQVLHFIKETLGFGKVIAQSSTTSRYITQSKLEIYIIINIFNGNIILPSKQKSFDKFVEGFNVWASKGNIKLSAVKVKHTSILPSLNDKWLAGFVDGEGCFTCSIGKDKGFSFNFNISQKEIINVKILYHISILFKGGIVSKHYVDNVYEYRLSGINKCKNVFFYFDTYKLYTKKSISYTLWKQVHNNLSNKHHLDPTKRLEIIEKARLINKFL